MDHLKFKRNTITGYLTDENNNVISKERLEPLILRWNNKYTKSSKAIDENGKSYFYRDIFSESVIKNDLKVWDIDYDMNLRNEFKNKMRNYTPDSSFYARLILTGILNAYEVENELKPLGFDNAKSIEFNVNMIMHWMWSVKRFALGYGVSKPMFINFYSADGGTGKTNLIRKLLEPTHKFKMDMKLEQFKDDRNINVFAENYVIFCDDMNVSSEGKDYWMLQAVIKNVLTATDINYRIMKTTTWEKAPRTFSPIATSNIKLRDMIIDESGHRRFYEVSFGCKGKDDQMAWDRLELIYKADIDKIWDGVDPDLPHGYITRGSEWMKALEYVQNSYKKGDIVDLFLKIQDGVYIRNDDSNEGILKSIDEAVSNWDVMKNPTAPLIGDGKEYELVKMGDLRDEIMMVLSSSVYDVNLEFLSKGSHLANKLKKREIHIVEKEGVLLAVKSIKREQQLQKYRIE